MDAVSVFLCETWRKLPNEKPPYLAYLLSVLKMGEEEDGNRSKTAKILGISQPTLRAKLRAYNR